MLIDFAKNLLNSGEKISVGIGGFTADVRLSESVEISSDVPDNYVEDGSVINDHIINSPVMLTLDGEVADIHVAGNSTIVSKIQSPVDRLLGISNNLFPSSHTQQMLDEVNSVSTKLSDAFVNADNMINNAGDLFNFFGGAGASPQDDFFNFIESVHKSKKLITISMPFRNYKNMRIVSTTIIRDNTTNKAMKYKISAKEVRFASTIMIDSSKYFKAPSKTASKKTASKKTKGVTEGTKVDATKKNEVGRSFLDVLVNG